MTEKTMNTPQNLNEINSNNLLCLVEYYEKRFEQTAKHFSDLDRKSRWLLSITLPISVAILGYLYSKYQETNICDNVGLIVLGSMIFTGAFFATFSVTLKSFASPDFGVEDNRSKITYYKWKPFLTGSTKELKIWYLTLLNQFTEAVNINEQSIRQKALFLKIGIYCSICSIPISIIIVTACILGSTPLPSDTSGIDWQNSIG